MTREEILQEIEQINAQLDFVGSRGEQWLDDYRLSELLAQLKNKGESKSDEQETA